MVAIEKTFPVKCRNPKQRPMHIKISAMLLLIVVVVSCRKDNLKVDVSGVSADVELQRLDQDLFKFRGKNDTTLIDSLRKAYDDFFTLYNKQIIGIGSSALKAYPSHLQSFLSDFRIQQAKQRTDEVFPSLKALRKSLTGAFRHMKYYFPGREIPSLYTMISGFNYSIVTDSGMIGIGLDKYLGRDYYFYGRLGWPEYQRYKMFPEKIPSDVMQAYASMEFPYQDSSDKLINRMIYQGKVKYFVKAMLPEQPDSLIFAYSENQMEWCHDNESYVWAYFLEKKLLFSNKKMIYQKYLEEGPFTSSFNRKAPARIGIWIGYQIVRAYMRKYPEVSLAGFMKNHNYQQIMNRSGYNP